MHLPVQLLGKWDQSADTAETLARDLAYGYKVKDCEPETGSGFQGMAGRRDRQNAGGNAHQPICGIFFRRGDQPKTVLSIPVQFFSGKALRICV